jgi:ubiquinone biosynthesis protein COQ9
MIDETTPEGRLIAAAMKLAAERPWKDVSLIEIADAADLTLADVRTYFDGKPAIVRGFVRAVDNALLAKARKPQPGEGPRDAIFEVVMARFDLLAPHKPAIRAIMKDADPDLSLIGSALASQQWMLSAAGIDSSGSRGVVRTLGLASVYASVFRTWLDDEDAGMARTMAALDRRLRRGERNLQAVEGMCETVTGFGKRLGELVGGARRDRGPAAEKKSPAADASPATGDSG